MSQTEGEREVKITMKNAVLLVALIVLGACTKVEKPLPDTPVKHFEKGYKIKAKKKVDFESLDILRPMELVSNSQWIATIDNGSREGCVCLISKDFKRCIRGLQVGQGPNDLSKVARLCVLNDTICVMDFNFRRLMPLKVSGDSLYVTSVNAAEALGGWGKTVLTGGRYLMPTLMDSLFIKIADGKGEVLSSIDYPDDKVLSEYSYMPRNSIYMNTCIAVSPDEKHFAYGVMYAETNGFGEIDGVNISSTKTYVYSSPQIGHVVEDGKFLIPAKTSRVNVLCATGNDDMAIFAYSGEGYDAMRSSNNLLVYKWDGTPKFRLVPDTPVMIIAVDNSRDVLMCIAYTPEAQYVEYDLKAIKGL